MITCEEPVDASAPEGSFAAAISDGIACTNVGEVREDLDKRVGPMPVGGVEPLLHG